MMRLSTIVEELTYSEVQDVPWGSSPAPRWGSRLVSEKDGADTDVGRTAIVRIDVSGAVTINAETMSP